MFFEMNPWEIVGWMVVGMPLGGLAYVAYHWLSRRRK